MIFSRQRYFVASAHFDMRHAPGDGSSGGKCLQACLQGFYGRGGRPGSTFRARPKGGAWRMYFDIYTYTIPARNLKNINEGKSVCQKHR